MVSRRLLGFWAAVLGVLGCMAMCAVPALATGDANVALCPNENVLGFESYLPDCRAYEMVSPIFKAGSPIGQTVPAPDGTRLLEQSLGEFAGTESDTELQGATYQLERSGSRWAASAISPAASVLPAQSLVGEQADLGKTLWEGRSGAESLYAQNFYVKEGESTPVEIGSLIPPAAAAGPPAGAYQVFFYRPAVAYLAASADLSHVLFYMSGEDPLWPGDTTAKTDNSRSLYEYAPGDTRPSLVGVDEDGNLLSDCETSLGASAEQDVYNAMSADGRTVYFTAVTGTLGSEHRTCVDNGKGEPEGTGPSVNELYARLNGEQTVDVSEPSHEACSACLLTAKANGEFAGASEDGSKVFFLSEQELFAGDATMNLFEYDFAQPQGQKVARVSFGSAAPEVQGVARVSEDGSHVYFVAKGVLTSGANKTTGLEPVGGENNLYVYERDANYPEGHLAFIGTLAENDESDWRSSDLRPVQATPDGRFLVFSSHADLTPGDTSSNRQVFEYDAQTEELVRVSIGQAGYAAGSESADEHRSLIKELQYHEATSPAAADTGLAVSDDGSTVLFESEAALTPQAVAAGEAFSVYVYRSGATISNGEVYFVSDGVNGLPATAVGLDGSGSDLFFRTAAELLPSVGDTQYGIYDARVDGGFPLVSAAPGCEGQGCRRERSSAPAFESPGTTSAPGVAVRPAVLRGPPKAKPKVLSRAERLTRALRACRRGARRRRAACERAARRRYGARPVAARKLGS
jgi:hypothetical protein